MCGVVLMNSHKLPAIVATLDANLYLMAPAQKKRFLRYRRAYILADKLATPVFLLSIGCVLLFPCLIVACLSFATNAAVTGVHLAWAFRVLPVVKPFLLPAKYAQRATAREAAQPKEWEGV